MLKQLLILAITTTVLPANAQIIYSGRDHNPIGIISKSQDQRDSICNEYGAGSEYRIDGIYNRLGTNGSDSGNYGAYNPYAKAPPYIVSGKTVYFITVKRTSYPYIIHPDLLKDWCYK